MQYEPCRLDFNGRRQIKLNYNIRYANSRFSNSSSLQLLETKSFRKGLPLEDIDYGFPLSLSYLEIF